MLLLGLQELLRCPQGLALLRLLCTALPQQLLQEASVVLQLEQGPLERARQSPIFPEPLQPTGPTLSGGENRAHDSPSLATIPCPWLNLPLPELGCDPLFCPHLCYLQTNSQGVLCFAPQLTFLSPGLNPGGLTPSPLSELGQSPGVVARSPLF